jgi:O-antigen ligase
MLAAGGQFYICATTLVACLLLGGSATGGLLPDVILQLLAVPLLLASLWRLADDREFLRQWWWVLLFCVALILLPLLQLVPLPPSIWTALPNRSLEAAAFEAMRGDLPWMPISVSPAATALSAISLVPALAVFVGTLLLGYQQRRLLSLLVLIFGVISVFLGLMQVAQGSTSPLRFYQLTNPTEAVGFFANRNHFASFLNVLIVFAAAWTVEAANTSSLSADKLASGRLIALLGGFTMLVLLVAAQAMARSRAGLGLAIVALLGGAAISFSDRGTTSAVTPTRLLAAAAALAAMFAAQFTLFRLLERFSVDPLSDGRIIFARVTTAAAKLYMPFGSGVGTFVPAYAGAETPGDAFLDTYVNRAHNEFLELWLETGVAGPSLVALFTLWLAARSLKVWRRNPQLAQVDLSLARAATIVIGLIMAHSFFDYPLRTSAVMVVMAFTCGLLVNPASEGSDLKNRRQAAMVAGGSRATGRRPKRPQPAPVDATHQGTERWGDEIDWPGEWRSARNSRDARKPQRQQEE